MNTFLITGGAGFIGSHLVERLIKNNKLIVIDNFHEFYGYKIKIKNLSEALEINEISFSDDKEKDINKLVNISKSDRFQLYYGDIRDEILLKKIFTENKIDAVIHLAALAGVRPSIENPIEYEAVNVKGSMLLLEQCKDFGVKSFVCASSSSVYGNNKKVPFSETDNVDFPISPYAATKKSIEVLSHVYHSLYGISVVQLRFFTVYGARQRPDLAIHKFTNLISKNLAIPFYGDGSTARDYTYIDDIIYGVTQSIEYALKNNNIFEIINLGESRVISLTQMVETLEKTIGIKAKINKMPLQAGDVIITNANIDKAKKLLSYNPQTDFEVGIKLFWEWFSRFY